MAGAGIIYVVDGSCPYGADYEAEMEILRWSGRPSLAVINPAEGEEFVEEWTAGLASSSHGSPVQRPPGRGDQATGTIGAVRASRPTGARRWSERWRFGMTGSCRRRASSYITDLIVGGHQLQAEQSVPKGIAAGTGAKLLFERYKAHLVKRERQCRQRVEELYYHSNLVGQRRPVAGRIGPVQYRGYLWGWVKMHWWRPQHPSAPWWAGVPGGAGRGQRRFAPGGLGTFVAGAGGASSVGLGSPRRYADKIGQMKVKVFPPAAVCLSYGPSKNINFPFVLLGRALLHQRADPQPHPCRAQRPGSGPAATGVVG